MIVPKTEDCIYDQFNLFHDNRLHMEEEEKKKKSERGRERDRDRETERSYFLILIFNSAGSR